jgi:L-asparaginase
MPAPVLILHGGAGRSIPLGRAALLRKKIATILALSYQKLLCGSALEAVTYAVSLLESDPEFNAGTGSMLQSDGKARLSASLMDGAKMRFCAVLNLESIAHPIEVVRTLMEKEDRVLAGPEALSYATRQGFELSDVRTAKSIHRWKKKIAAGFDTVGACALDSAGRLASATSTGGKGFETPGRVSDSGTPAGNYASGEVAVSATGTGEEILDEGLAVRIVTRVEDGLPLRKAFQKTFRDVRRRRHQMGAIGLDRKGNWAQDKTTESLLFAVQTSGKTDIF